MAGSRRAARRLPLPAHSLSLLAVGLVVCCIVAGASVASASVVHASVSGYDAISAKLQQQQQQQQRRGQTGFVMDGAAEGLATGITDEQRSLLRALAFLALPGNEHHTELAAEVAEALESKRLVLPPKTMLEFPFVHSWRFRKHRAALCAFAAAPTARVRGRVCMCMALAEFYSAWPVAVHVWLWARGRYNDDDGGTSTAALPVVHHLFTV